MFHLSFHKVSLHVNSFHTNSFAFAPGAAPTTGVLFYRITGGVIAWRINV
jgi:hypothetical protein